MKGFKFLTFLFICLCFSNLSNAQNTLNNLGLTSSNLASVAFSVRKLSSAYTGPLMRVRVNTNYYDVYPDASADHQISLNSLISAPISYGSSITSASANNLQSLSATEAYVAIWYDQSGNSNDLKQSSDNNQPKIIENSIIITEGSYSKPFLRWSITSYCASCRQSSIDRQFLQLVNPLSTNGQVIIINKFANDDYHGFLLGDNNPGSYFWHPYPQFNELFVNYGNSSSIENGSIFQNGNYKSSYKLTNYHQGLGINSVAPKIPNDQTYWDNIGSERNGVFHNTTNGSGYSEILSFPTKLNQTLRSSVESNQSAYFGITLNSTNDPNAKELSISSPIATLTSCSGTASSPTTFGVTGSGLTASVTISAPTNFEISISSGGTYSSSLTLTNTPTVSQTLYVRLNSSATAGDKTGNITATSTGASDATTSVNGTVNAIPSISINETDVSGSADNDSKVCKGGSATLTASGGSTYSWNTSPIITTAAITPSLSSNTTYTVTGTSAAGCSNITSVIITVEALPTLSVSSISLCAEATYLITKTTSMPVDNGWSVSGTITVNNGYVTAGTTTASNYTVSYTDGCAQTASATVTVNNSDISPAITGQASYKISNTNPIPQGPTASLYVGYNGYNYFSATKPTNTGYYKANNQSGSSAGCPYPFYIFRCTTCPD